ncbi:MAG TPA: extracellular solute-binding protein [Actinocrinis sp.]|nr:extracellular solute-binding protein [Actinocrinis sp.]
MKLSRAATTAACAVAAVALAAGCSSSSSPATTASADANQKVNLTFWSWVPNMDKIVAAWNQSHPNIQITFTKAAGGDPELTKLLTSGKAHTMPDLAQVEYQSLPTMVSNNYLADISQYVNNIKSDYPDGLWNQVTLGTSAVYGVPQDAAPLAYFYRTDLFKQYGLTPPTTWAQYQTEAEQVHKAHPNVYLGDTATTDGGLFSGLTQQAGAKWWSAAGNSWTVGIDSAPSQKVASYWGSLVKEGAVDNKTAWTADWSKALDNGTYLSWVAAVWAPGTLASEAADTSGKWAMAPLPQWNAGDQVTGNWGGSATSVTSDSKHPRQAAEFITWLNHQSDGVNQLVTQGNVYPASLAAEGSSTLAIPAFVGGQSDFYTLAKQYSKEAATATWGPNVNVAYSAFSDAFGAAATNKGDFLAALSTVQQKVVADMKANGFTVSGS